MAGPEGPNRGPLIKHEWKDGDRIRKFIAEEIPAKVAGDRAYQNAMRNSDKENARIEHDRVLARVVNDHIADQTEFFKQFSDNADFKRWIAEMVFAATYSPPPVGDEVA
jgi:type I restriction enzyme, R subunit